MPSGVLTLAQIRTNAQQKADMVNSQFLTTAEWNFNINQSLLELYDVILQHYGDDYYVAEPYEFTTDGQEFLIDLPEDFYKFLGLDLALSNTLDSWVTIRRFNFADRNRYAVPNFQSFYGVTNLRYRLRGNQLWLTPIPAGGQSFRMYYVPRCTELVDDADTADGFGGWLEYVIVDAALKAVQKAELDPTTLAAMKDALLQRIVSVAENRDAANPGQVADTAWSDYWWPCGNGSGGGGGSY
jgi:hypothetical protein